MPVYGDPLMLHTSSILFFSISEALRGEENSKTRWNASERAGEALEYVRTAIVQASIFRSSPKRTDRPLKFGLIEWCRFKADRRYRSDKELIIGLLRTLRRLQRGIPVTPSARNSVVIFFEKLSQECSSKGDSSSMAIGDSDD
jgi:hypothetical protein